MPADKIIREGLRPIANLYPNYPQDGRRLTWEEFLTNPQQEQPIQYRSGTEALNKLYSSAKYWNDRGTETFKYGLQQQNIQNQDEDPVIFGFDFYLDNINSPLLGEGNESVQNFIDWASEYSFSDFNQLQNIWDEFKNQLYLFFDKTHASNQLAFKTHYLKSVSGLEKLVEQGQGMKMEQITPKWNDDKIELTLREDLNINLGYLAMLYKKLSWSRIRGKTLIPDNSLRFNCNIVISEMRNFNRIKTYWDSALGEATSFSSQVSGLNPLGGNNQGAGVNAVGSEVVNAIHSLNSNVSRYVYRLYDCQFQFNNMPHPNEVKNDDMAVFEDGKIELSYKFSTMKLEKFKLTPDGRGGLKNSSYTIIDTADIDGYNTGDADNETNAKPQIESRYRTNYDSSGKLSPWRMYNIQIRDQLVNNDENATGIDTIKRIAKQSLKYGIGLLEQRRDELLNSSIRRIRDQLGVSRGLSQPQNVYKYDPYSLLNFASSQLGDFANQQITNSLGGLNQNFRR